MPIGQDEDIRIYELPEAQELTAGMKVAVDSETDGTKSFDLTTAMSEKVEEFVAEYNVTSYEDIDAAYKAGKSVICKYQPFPQGNPEQVYYLRSMQYIPFAGYMFGTVTSILGFEFIVCRKNNDTTVWSVSQDNALKTPESGQANGKILSTNGTNTLWIDPPEGVPSSTVQDEGKVLTVDSNGAAAWELAPTGKIAVFDGEKSMSSGTTWPDEVEVRAALDAGKYVVIRMTSDGGDEYYTIRWKYAYQYFFSKVGSTRLEIRLERNTAGTAYEWSYYGEPVSPGAKIFTGTYNPAASPADYSGMPNTLDIAAALDADNDVVLMLTNPADGNVYAYRLSCNEEYNRWFVAMDRNSSTGGWKHMPAVRMQYAGPGNPWIWRSEICLSQELKTGSITESDLTGGHCNVNNLNALTMMTLTSVNSVTMHTADYNAVNNFTVDIDNTGNSNAVTVDVQHGPSSLKYSVSAGNIVGAGKYVQLICIGNCWRLEEFV